MVNRCFCIEFSLFTEIQPCVAILVFVAFFFSFSNSLRARKVLIMVRLCVFSFFLSLFYVRVRAQVCQNPPAWCCFSFFLSCMHTFVGSWKGLSCSLLLLFYISWARNSDLVRFVWVLFFLRFIYPLRFAQVRILFLSLFIFLLRASLNLVIRQVWMFISLLLVWYHFPLLRVRNLVTLGCIVWSAHLRKPCTLQAAAQECTRFSKTFFQGVDCQTGVTSDVKACSVVPLILALD